MMLNYSNVSQFVIFLTSFMGFVKKKDHRLVFSFRVSKVLMLFFVDTLYPLGCYKNNISARDALKNNNKQILPRDLL